MIAGGRLDAEMFKGFGVVLGTIFAIGNMNSSDAYHLAADGENVKHALEKHLQLADKAVEACNGDAGVAAFRDSVKADLDTFASFLEGLQNALNPIIGGP